VQGTENVIGIAGLGALGAAAAQDLAHGVWELGCRRLERCSREGS